MHLLFLRVYEQVYFVSLTIIETFSDQCVLLKKVTFKNFLLVIVF
jgi:hypothetical protein